MRYFAYRQTELTPTPTFGGKLPQSGQPSCAGDAPKVSNTSENLAEL